MMFVYAGDCINSLLCCFCSSYQRSSKDSERLDDTRYSGVASCMHHAVMTTEYTVWC